MTVNNIILKKRIQNLTFNILILFGYVFVARISSLNEVNTQECCQTYVFTELTAFFAASSKSFAVTIGKLLSARRTFASVTLVPILKTTK